jgi:hypothetical protein
MAARRKKKRDVGEVLLSTRHVLRINQTEEEGPTVFR